MPTPVVGIVPDQLLELQHGEHRGRWLLTAHTRLQPVATPLWTVRTWSSDDGGTSWQGPHKIAEVPGLQLCEPTLVELDTGEVIAFLRENSGQG